MTLRKQIKQNAKRCLYTNWGKAIAIVLLSAAIYLLFSLIEVLIAMLVGVVPYEDIGYLGFALDNIPNVSTMSIALTAVITVGSFLIITPLNLGISGWYWRLSDNESDDILTIFQCFSSRKMFFRPLWLRISITLRAALWGVLIMGIPAAIIAYCSIWAPRGIAATLGAVFGAALLLVTTIFWILVLQRYFLARYYLLDGTTKVRAAIKKSVHATKGERDAILMFQFSYIGWFLLNLFVIPWVYSKPYYNMSCVLYARFLMESDMRHTQLVPYQPPTEQAGDGETEQAPISQEPQQGEDIFATKTFDAQNFHKNK